MRNSKDVALVELRLVLKVATDKGRQEVLAAVAAGALAVALDLEGPALGQLLAGDARDQRVLRVEGGDPAPQRVAAQQDVDLGDLADDAVVLLAVVDGLDGALLVDARGHEAEGPPEGHLAQHVEGEEVQPVAEVDDGVAAGETRLLEAGDRGVGAELVEPAHEEVDGVVDEGAELAHRRHRVRHVGYLLLHRVHVLAHLSEDIRVLRRREHRVEVRLVEALAGREDVSSDHGRGERELVGSDAHDGSVLAVQGDVVEMRAFGGRGHEFPDTRAGSQEGAWVVS